MNKTRNRHFGKPSHIYIYIVFFFFWFAKFTLNPMCIHKYHKYTYIHYITLHYTTLHYITLHYITLHTFIHTYIHTFIHTYINTYIHTYNSGPFNKCTRGEGYPNVQGLICTLLWCLEGSRNHVYIFNQNQVSANHPETRFIKPKIA